MQATTVICGTGRTAVTLKSECIGQDFSMLLTAGSAHVGATALAVPCPPNAEGVTASVSVLTVPGHRDDIPAGRLALRLCKALNRPVTLTAGMHVDNATKDDIATLLKNADEAVSKLLSTLAQPSTK